MSQEKEFVLPDDHYGILLETEEDIIKLQYLISEIGELKLRSTVSKYTKNLRGAKPYLSKILKAYGVKVPVHLYRAKEISIYGVYVLVRSNMSAIKIGVSKDFLQRAISMLKVASIRDAGGLFEYFDPDKSFVYQIGEKKDSEVVEKMLLEMTKDRICTQDDGISWGSGGKKEWREIDVLSIVLAELQVHPKIGKKITLREALSHWQMMGETDINVPNGRVGYVNEQFLL